MGRRSGLIRRGNVLVIDDDTLVRHTIARLLAAHHDVALVSSAEDGLRRLRDGHTYDVILCDMMMPGMTGMDFHIAVSAQFPHVVRRIVFVTGGGFTPVIERFVAGIDNPVLDKPIDVHALRGIVRRYVIGHESTPE